MIVVSHTPSRSWFASLVLAVAMVTSPCAYAEKADKEKPTIIDADKSSHQELTQTDIFEGNVILTKGTLTIKAQRIEVKYDQEGYQMAQANGAAGKPATYRQKRDVVNEFIEAEALTINFNGKEDTVLLTDQAIMRRMSASNVMLDEVRGAVIKYFNQTEFYDVKGGPTSSHNGGRVRTVLSPRAPAPTPAPTSPAKK